MIKKQVYLPKLEEKTMMLDYDYNGHLQSEVGESCEEK